jgi:2-hydroxy-3-keto-5-methylthiopentenyl-1-phosphate phosphatase
MTSTFKDRFYTTLKKSYMKSLSKRGLKVDKSISDGFFKLVLDSLDESLNETFKLLADDIKTLGK